MVSFFRRIFSAAFLVSLCYLAPATTADAQESGPYSKATENSVATLRKKAAQPEAMNKMDRMVTSPPIEVIGEVVDAWCYASGTMGPGRGPTHQACALACINGGVTPGIAEDKTGILWIAAKYKGYQGCREILLPFVARHVKVKGWAAHIGSCNLLKIKTIQVIDGPDAGKTFPEPPKSPSAPQIKGPNISKSGDNLKR